MGHPASSFTLGIPFASTDGKFYSRYPQGDRFAVPAVASGAMPAVSVSVVNAAASGANNWSAFTGPTFQQGTASTFSFAAFAPTGSTGFRLASTSAALPSGVTLDSPNKRLVYDGVGPVASVSGVIIEDVSALSDWLLRSGQDPNNPQPDVVWFHGFETDAEVANFRWRNGFAGGNDPAGTSTPQPNWCRRITTDGVIPGKGCLEIFHALGTLPGQQNQEGQQWWRPLSPFNAGGNGRATNDPAANGTITRSNWSPTSGGNQTGLYQSSARPGWYGHTDYHTGSVFDGSSFCFQMRVKMDPRRTTPGNTQVGKLIFFTTTSASLSAQEIVTYSGAFPVSGVGQPNYFRMYKGGANPLEDYDTLGRPGSQLGSDLANYPLGQYCGPNSGDPTNLRQYCWAWSGGWDTVMYRITPGHNGVADSRIEVWAAHEGVQTYTKIWDEMFVGNFETGFDTQGGQFRNGWNAILLATYQNGLANSDFWHRYDQLILSKSFIPCPKV